MNVHQEIGSIDRILQSSRRPTDRPAALPPHSWLLNPKRRQLGRRRRRESRPGYGGWLVGGWVGVGIVGAENNGNMNCWGQEAVDERRD